MKYQLRYLLHQLEHRKMTEIQEQGQVSEWVFPLQKAARQALEVLELGLVSVEQQAQAQAVVEAPRQVAESDEAQVQE